jgi:hypothetical protein
MKEGRGVDLGWGRNEGRKKGRKEGVLFWCGGKKISNPD